MLTVMFLNTWGGSIPGPLHAYIKSVADSVDVFCFSEVHNCATDDAQEFMAPKDKGHRIFPLHIKQYENILMDALGRTHNGYFTPAMQFCLHDLESVDEPVQYGIAMFVRKTLPVISFRSGMIFREYNRKNDGVPASRGIQSACILHEDVRYIISHFHGLWTEVGKGDTAERLGQSVAVSNFITAHAQDESTLSWEWPKVILGGDFNLMTGSESFRILQESRAFGFGSGGVNLNDVHNVTDTRTHYYPKEKPTREADFVIVSPDIPISSYTVVRDPVVSDHCPLILSCDCV